MTKSTSDSDDLVLSIAGISDTIVLDNQGWGWGYGVERVAFADGTTWTDADLRQAYLTQATTAGNDTIVGFRTDDRIVGGLGNDALKGG